MLEKLFDICKRKFAGNKKDIATADECLEENKKLTEKLLQMVDNESDVLVTVTGLQYYFGSKPFENGNKVYFYRDPENRFDTHAVKVICDGFGKCGYVANSERTLKQGTLSADLFYGAIGEYCTGEVLLTEERFSVCSVNNMTYYDLILKHGKCLAANGDYQNSLRIFRALESKKESVILLRMIENCYMMLSDDISAESYRKKILQSELCDCNN